jgi:hypothetical protein
VVVAQGKAPVGLRRPIVVQPVPIQPPETEHVKDAESQDALILPTNSDA